MARYLKWLVTPQVILLVSAVVLFGYVASDERQVEEIVGCWNCGWETRQAFYLVLAVGGLLIARWWTVSLSLLLGLKVLYTIGHVTFWNNIAERHGVWPILISSLQWSAADTHVEFFVLLALATIVLCYAAFLVRRLVST